MSKVWFWLAVYVIMTWFVVCLYRATKQIIAKWDMITLLNKNKIVSGDYELHKRDTSLRNVLKVTFRMMFFI
jgi:hypothetical protein